MNRMSLVFWIAVISWPPMFTSIAACQEPDIAVRTSVDPNGEALVGQKIKLTIDVLAKDAWASLSRLPQIEIPGAIVFFPDSQSLRLNETIGDSSYTGQQYEWWVYPRRKGTISIGAIEIEVKRKVFGSQVEPVVSLKKTEPISLEVAYPEGVSSANDLVCAASLEVKEEWNPTKTDNIKVGDGVTRTITRTIGGAPGMLLPVISPDQLDGVRAYPKQPSVNDSSNRGDLIGKRMDAVTYVFEASGSFTFPAIKFAWWNEDAKQLETIDLPERTFEVVAAVSSEDSGAIATAKSHGSPTDQFSRSTLVWLAAAVLLAIVGYFSRDWLKQKYGQLIDRPFFQERLAFNALITAARTQNTNDTVAKLYRWINFPLHDQDAPQVEILLNRFAAETDANQIRKLVLANSDTDWDATKFIRVCKQLRKNWQLTTRHSNEKRSSALPELN